MKDQWTRRSMHCTVLCTFFILLVFTELHLFDTYECTNANTYYYYKYVCNYWAIKATCI